MALFDYLPLDQRIAQLTTWCATPPEGADVPELLGTLGMTLLDQYDRDGDPDLLDAGIDRCGEALRAAPDHPDRNWWYLGLGLAHNQLARLRHQPAHYDQAVEWLRRLYEEFPPADPARDEAASLLVDTHWERYRVRGETGVREIDGARRLVAVVSAVRVNDPASEPAAHYRLVLGLSQLARFDETGDRPDLDAGIDALRVALVAPLPETRWFGLAWAALCEAYRVRAGLDRDETSLGLAVDAGEYATIVVDPDDSFAPLLTARLASAYRTQWQLSRTAGSLEAADLCLDRVLGVDGLDIGFLLSVHLERLAVGAEMLAEGLREHADRPRRDAARLRRYLDDARAVGDRDGGAGRDRMAGPLAWGETFLAMVNPGTLDVPRIRDLLDRARQASGAPPSWLPNLDAAEAMVEYLADTSRPDAGADFGVHRLLQSISSEHLDPALGQELRNVMPYAAHLRANRRGDRRAAEATDSLLTPAGVEGGLRAFMLIDTLGFDLFSNVRHDADLLVRTLTELRAFPSHPAAAAAMAPFEELLERMCVLAGVEPSALPPRAVTPPGPSSARWPGLDVLTLLSQHIDAMVAGDLTAQRQFATRLREIADAMPAGHVARIAASVMGALVELSLASNGPDPLAAARAARWCEEAAALAGGPDHPIWRLVGFVHAQSLRWAGEENRARSREIGMSALRAHAWQAMAQSGTDFALASVRRASDYASDIANWCLADDAYEDLVRVLDAGRGIALQAATASRQVADRLVEAGRPELAEEYLATGGLGRDELTGRPLGPAPSGTEVPDDLRTRVLRALSTDGATRFDPLETVDIGEIQQALAAVDADALVYLMAEEDGRYGVAVVVPAAGPGGAVALPELVAGPGSPVSRHLASAGRGRDLAPPGEVASRAEALDALCRWAWSAAMGKLIGRLREIHPGRPVRLVLVPMGMLGLVPWHAAYTDDGGGGRRYAIEDAVISYSVSARMLCAAARHRLRPVGSALVVGDPDGTLPFAGVEAQAIRQRFYPGGSYFGRHGETVTPAGTPEQVLDWVATAAGPSLLHFACHGVVDPRRPADAHLVLAGGTLTARRLLEVSRLSALAIDQVFLAACTTNVAGDDYDEAFSLATAFLAAGARTVFGSLWPVPDAETSLLMYLVHHFINVDSCAPVDALHRAQRWMLDPARRPPEGMPAALARQAARPEAADPLSWAAFTHLGR